MRHTWIIGILAAAALVAGWMALDHQRTTGDLQPAISALADALDDSNDGVRQAAAHTLRRVGKASVPVFPQIIGAFSREQDAYRWGVLLDILLMAPEEAKGAVPILEDALESPSFYTRIRADQALRAIRDE